MEIFKRDSLWQKLCIISGLMLLMAIFCMLFFTANIEIKDFDLWLHLGVGGHIWQNGFHVPGSDFLSCTIAGKPWFNHEWLFQVLVYPLFKTWGAAGIINMQVTLVMLTMMLLLFLGYNRGKQIVSLLGLFGVAMVYQTRFTTRPDLFSLFFFTIYILVLSSYLHKKWSLYFLVLIQILWANTHGFFFFGPLFAAIGLASEWIKRHISLPYEWNKVGRLSNDEYRRLKMILGAVILACFVNPQGIQGAIYPLKVFFHLGESQVFFDRIIELKKPITFGNIFSIKQFLAYKILIIVSFLSIVFNRKKLDISALIFWIIFLLFSLAAIRNLVFFAVAAYLVLVTNMVTLQVKDIIPVRLTSKKFGYSISIFIKVILTIWIINYCLNKSLNGYFDFDTYERKMEFAGGISLRNFPYKAVDFLVENKVKGNFYNDFNSGAYLVGRCFPDIKVFIDGRTEVYGVDFFSTYQKTMEFDDPEAFEELLDKYKINGAFMNSTLYTIPERVLKYLYDSEEWIPVYFNHDAIIFLRDVEDNREVIANNRIDFEDYVVPRMDLYRLGNRKVSPYQHIFRAFTLEALGLDDMALAELEEVKRIAPYKNDIFKLTAKIYAKRKNYEKAYENFRIAVVLAPGNRGLRHNMALALYDMGNYDYAKKQYKKIMEKWPNHARAYLQMAKIYAREEKYDPAHFFLTQYAAFPPVKTKKVFEAADIVFENGDFESAKKFYAIGLKAEENLNDVHIKLAEVYLKLDKKDEAGSEIKKAIKLDPEDEEILDKIKELGFEVNSLISGKETVFIKGE